MTAQRQRFFRAMLLRRLDLQQPGERRLVLLIERHHVYAAEAFGWAIRDFPDVARRRGE